MNNTLRNGMNLLELLAGTVEPHSLTDLAKEMKLPKSHIFRLLKTFREMGYVEQDKERRYFISLKMLMLGNVCLRRMTIRIRLRPFLYKLAGELNRDVHLQVPYFCDAMVVDVISPKGERRDVGLDIGNINPLNYSAGGKICAAYASNKQLDEAIAMRGLKKMTRRTITNVRKFKEELVRVREEKIAVVDSERIQGNAAVAAPVFYADGTLAAAIGTVLPDGRHTDAEWTKFKKALRDTAESASFALGCMGYGETRFDEGR